MSRSSKGRTAASTPQHVDKVAAADAPAPESSSSPRLSGAMKRNLITLIVVGFIAAGVAVAGSESSKPKLTGDTISQTFSQGQPCATADIPITVPSGGDSAKVAQTLFEALRSAPGMNSATYNVRTSTLEAGFCESKGSEAAVREALAPTGLVLASEAPSSQGTGAATEATPVDQNGGLVVDVSSGSFDPAQITVPKGKPLEITFSQGSGCVAEVVFPDLGIRQSLESGPAKVKLPALEPGTYEFACGMDMQRGTLIVQ